MVAPDPEVVMGQGRALFRVSDLVGLAQLVALFSSEKNSNSGDICKDNFAAIVKELTPR